MGREIINNNRKSVQNSNPTIAPQEPTASLSVPVTDYNTEYITSL